MNCLEEGLLNFLLPNLSSQQLQPDLQPFCFLASDHLSTNSFPERGYQGQARDGSTRALIPSSAILDCIDTALYLLCTTRSLSLSFSGDITVEGLDGERPLQTGEVVIIVVVLLMWAGE